MTSWNLKPVADEQLQLVSAELEHDLQAVAPYRYFLEAMEFLGPRDGTTLLDVGCGVGHYGVLCQRNYPFVRYFGTDSSEHMIAHARKLCPGGDFSRVKFGQNKFSRYDIILASGILEYTGAWGALRLLLKQARGWIVLHRLRLTQEESGAFLEPTYAGHSEMHYRWNADELRAFIGRYARIEKEIAWDDDVQVTIICQRGVSNK